MAGLRDTEPNGEEEIREVPVLYETAAEGQLEQHGR